MDVINKEFVVLFIRFRWVERVGGFFSLERFESSVNELIIWEGIF